MPKHYPDINIHNQFTLSDVMIEYAGTFQAANNQSSPSNVTGLSFPNSDYRSFNLILNVNVVGTSNSSAQYTIEGVQGSNGWGIFDSFVGDETGLVFSVSNDGQIRYTSTNVTGWTSTIINYQVTAYRINGSFSNVNLVTSANTVLPGTLTILNTSDADGISGASLAINGGLSVAKNVTLGGGMTIGNHIIPNTNIAYDLGSSTNRWRDLYLSGNTIDLGGVPISTSTTGSISFGATVLATTTSGNTGTSIANLASKTIQLSNNSSGSIMNMNINNAYRFFKSSNAPGAWYNSSCWSPELSRFVAVSYQGSVSYSDDGINWTSATAPSRSWNSVCWAPDLGIFCAVSNGAESDGVMTSEDGINWTLRTPSNTAWWESVCWSPQLGIFVAVNDGGGTGGRVMTSSDGSTWIQRNSSNNNNWWYSVTWSPELEIFCAVAYSGGGDNNLVMTSNDGEVWYGHTTPNDNGNWGTITWSPSLGLFAVGSWGTGLMTSPDGITWTARLSSSTINTWQNITWISDLNIFMAVSWNNTVESVDPKDIIISTNGIDWTYLLEPINPRQYFSTISWSPTLKKLVLLGIYTVYHYKEVSIFEMFHTSGNNISMHENNLFIQSPIISINNTSSIITLDNNISIKSPIVSINTTSSNISIGKEQNSPFDLSINAKNNKVCIYSNNDSQTSSLYLGTPPGAYPFFAMKTAIIAEGYSSSGRSRLHLCLNNSSDISTFGNASISDSRMTLLPSGYVGIGTTSPAHTLDINGDLNVASGNYSYLDGLRISGGDPNSIYQDTGVLGITTNNNDIVLSTANGNAKVYIRSETTLGNIQLSPLIQNRNIVLYDGHGDEHQFYGFGINSYTLRYQVESTSAAHRFYAATSATSSNELMSINGNGNVGIGTTSPSSALEVNGDIKATNMSLSNNLNVMGTLTVVNITNTNLLTTTSTASIGTLVSDTLISSANLSSVNASISNLSYTPNYIRFNCSNTSISPNSNSILPRNTASENINFSNYTTGTGALTLQGSGLYMFEISLDFGGFNASENVSLVFNINATNTGAYDHYITINGYSRRAFTHVTYLTGTPTINFRLYNYDTGTTLTTQNIIVRIVKMFG